MPSRWAVGLVLLARTTAWPKIEECPHFPGSTPIAEYHACILDREPVVLHLGVAEGAVAVVGGHLGVEVDRLVVLLQRVREVRLLEQLIALVLNRLPHATALSHQPPAIRPQRSDLVWA